VRVRNIGFQNSLLSKIFRLSVLLEQEAETDLKVSFALTFSQFRALEALLEEGRCSQRELADRLGVTPAMVTRQAEALSSKGLLTQNDNPDSKREKLLALTPKGEKAATDAVKIVHTAQQRVLSGVDLQVETQFARALDDVLRQV